jgi:flagellar biosynthetic protein FlhB
MISDPPSAEALPGLLLEALGVGAWIVLPIAGAALSVAATTGLLQVGPLFAWRAPMPDLSRLSPSAGLGRVFSGARLLRLLILLATSSALVGLVWSAVGSFLRLVQNAPTAFPLSLGALGEGLLDVILGVVATLLFVGAVDYVLRRLVWKNGLRMTLSEVRRERRETAVKPELVQARQDVMGRLPSGLLDLAMAELLVANLSDAVALALRGDPGTRTLVVVARGSGAFGRALRARASELKVPLHESAELTSALIGLPEGGAVPSRLFEALARVYRQRVLGV